MKFKGNKNISIAGKMINDESPVFIIAEAGVAHFGSLEKALRLIDFAVAAHADAVKFQLFDVDAFISSESIEWKKRYREKALPFEDFHRIKSYCSEKEIIFLATAHDEPSLNFLDTLDVPAYKVGSGEIGNWPFIKSVAARGKPLLLSTGMYTLQDIDKALEVIDRTGNHDIIVLHCVTQYPTPPHDVNLSVINAIRKRYNVLVGYSDHTRGFHFPLAAVSCGACVIEKHISLDFDVPNAQDWKVACGKEEFLCMVNEIQDIKIGLGSGDKVPNENEIVNLQWARKSLVAATDITQGETITRRKLCAKRPGYGILPADLNKVIGKKAKITIKADTVIRREHLV